MSVSLTVVIPAHNPREDYLQLALEALKSQSLSTSRWEIVVVDNRSDPPLENRVDIHWHPEARLVREETLGLTRARLKGFEQMTGRVAVLVDDDNVLAHDYLEHVAQVAEQYPMLGAWGGVIAPRYEDPTLAPPQSLLPLLTLRAAAHDCWSNDPDHHLSTPWGAGLCVRRTVAIRYAEELRARPERQALDLQGKRLLYGGDTDIAYTACRMELGKGVFTRLRLEHLIPAARCSAEYLCRVAEGRGYSEVLHEFLLTSRKPIRKFSTMSAIRTQLRRFRSSSLEREAMLAHERGRRLALQDLA